MSSSLNVTKKQVLAADAAMFMVAIVWGAGFPFSADLLNYFTPMWMVACRVSLGAFFMLVFLHKKIFSANREAIIASLCVGAIVTTMFTLMTWGLYHSSPGKQAFISGTYVVQVPFLAWLIYKRRPTAFAIAGAALATVGLAVMSFTPGMNFVWGDIFNLLLALACAGQVMAVGYFAKKVDTITLAALHLVFASIFLLVMASIMEPLPQASSFVMRSCIELLIVSLGGTVIAFLVQYTAQRYTPESHAAVLMSLESPFGYFIAVWLGLDPWSLQAMGGGALIMGGVLLTELEMFVSPKKE